MGGSHLENTHAQQGNAMTQVTFRSNYKSYRVAFPPETFGYAQTNKIMRNFRGEAMTDSTDPAKPMYEQVMKPGAKFEQGMLVLDDEKPADAILIVDLRRILEDEELGLHTTDFWEEDPRVTAHVDARPDEVSITFPATLTPEDEGLIQQLGTYFHNAIPGPAVKSAAAKLQDAIARFNVVGIAVPGPGRVKLLKGRIVELCYAMDDAAKAAGVKIPLNLEVRESA